MNGIAPHGGRLVQRAAARDVAGLPRVRISRDLANDAENIADGIFSPLEGFLNEEDFGSVLERGRLANDVAWTVPIVLNVDADAASTAKDAGAAVLADPDGVDLAVIDVEDPYRFDKKEFAQKVYGTLDEKHPGVATVYGMRDVMLGGRVELLRRPNETKLREHRMTPAETREMFASANWKTVCAFQTRNPPHVAHEMLQKAALAVRDGVFVNPLIGRKKPGDFADEVIVRAYEAMIGAYYPPDRCRLATLHTEMRYAGPREAVHHAIMRQNYGCTHIIIGRDHAGVGDYYDPFAAHRIFDDYPDLEIEPVFFPAFFYCRDCLNFTHPKACPHGEGSREQISGTRLREMIQAGTAPSRFILRPEVAQVIIDSPRPFV